MIIYLTIALVFGFWFWKDLRKLSDADLEKLILAQDLPSVLSDRVLLTFLIALGWPIILIGLALQRFSR